MGSQPPNIPNMEIEKISDRDAEIQELLESLASEARQELRECREAGVGEERAYERLDAIWDFKQKMLGLAWERED